MNLIIDYSKEVTVFQKLDLNLFSGGQLGRHLLSRCVRKNEFVECHHLGCYAMWIL
jgi:hypothetical protein